MKDRVRALGYRELAIGAAHLAVLWAFAVAQPLLDLLGDAPEFFVARGNTRGDIILLAVAVTVVPPLVLAGVEALASPANRRGTSTRSVLSPRP